MKLCVFVAVLLPAAWLVVLGLDGGLGARPVKEALKFVGEWAVRLLLLSLAVTPLRRLLRWPGLIAVRRMVGVASAAYAALHFGLYVVDQKLDLLRVASEIALRIYLTIGFVTLSGLIALAATSTDGAMRRLGGKSWQRLHRLVYAIAPLALLHFCLQSKADVSEPMLLLGAFLWLMACRVLHDRGIAIGVPALIGLAFAAAGVTALTEAAWYALASGVDARRVLAANLAPEVAVRPALWVLLAGLAAAASAALRSFGWAGRRAVRAGAAP